MLLRDIMDCLEGIAPLSLQESYDNSGLLVGSPDWVIHKALVCLDSTEEVIDEAIRVQANLVIAHHPIVFSGLKRFNGKNHIERAVMKAIKNDIAIYAIHTNLDNVLQNGVNQKMADKLGLVNCRVLAPKSGQLLKLVVFCPNTHAQPVREALFDAGAGKIGNYDSCSFNVQGEGTFKANALAKPFVGSVDAVHHEAETRIEVVFPAHLRGKVLKAMFASHPYEEVAYDLLRLENVSNEIGSGLIGELPEPESQLDFLNRVKAQMQVPMIRYVEGPKEKVSQIALCGGSGSFLLADAIHQSADVFLSSDFKYHQFFESEGRIMIADIGHYEGEYFTIELLHDLLKENFPTFAVHFSEIRTNPLNYHC